MRKKVLTASIILIIFFTLITSIIYAEGKGVISIPTREVKTGEKLKVYINLENIKEYQLLKINLNTDIYLEPVLDVADTGITSENAIFDSLKKTFTIEKVPTDVKTICVVYTIPTYIADNTKIKLTSSVLDVEEKVRNVENVEITIVGDNNKNEDIPNKAEDGKKDDVVEKTEEKNNIEISNANKSVNKQQSTVGGTTETVSYKGSRNNYLSNLEIQGYEISPIFNKTNNTYFLTVDNTVKSLTIVANKEDSSAVVTVSGNSNLKTGLNKVLISVVAQNGDTRYYRIYITKEA